MNELWIVVCTDFHAAVGPYHSTEEALAVADRLTAEGGCVYVPVEVTEVEQVSNMPSPPSGGKDHTHPGQYL